MVLWIRIFGGDFERFHPVFWYNLGDFQYILLILIFNLTTWRHFGKKINIFLFMNLFCSSLTTYLSLLLPSATIVEITILFSAETSLSKWSFFFPFSRGANKACKYETRQSYRLGKAEIWHFLPRLWKTSNNRKLNNYWSMSKCVILKHWSPFLHPVKSK